MPLYGNPVFMKHGFFAGRWPVKQMGLTTMDYSKVELPETAKILSTGVRIVVNDSMTESYAASMGEAIRKVAAHYAA